MFTSTHSRCVLLLACGSVFAATMGGCSQQDADTQAQVQRPETTPNDAEVARLLVDLELRTRAVIASYYGKADKEHQAWMANNLCLPAAVADRVFYETVPQATRGRAWVKMVVDSPRNPNNRGDDHAVELMRKIVTEGKKACEVSTPNAVYYGRPIVAKQACLTCHGEPAGKPDPFFPQYVRNGWKEGDVIGAVVARVAPAPQTVAKR